MELLTPEIREKLLANGRSRDSDHTPVVRFFNPAGAGTWLATDADPEDTDIVFALADLGMGAPELGSVRLSELQSFQGPRTRQRRPESRRDRHGRRLSIPPSLSRLVPDTRPGRGVVIFPPHGDCRCPTPEPPPRPCPRFDTGAGMRLRGILYLTFSEIDRSSLNRSERERECTWKAETQWKN